MAEVINLSDDDDEIIIENEKRKERRSGAPKVFRCLNPDCRAEKDLEKASEVVRRYYGVLLYPRKTKVCAPCALAAKDQQCSFVETLRLGKTLLAERLPAPKDTVVLTESESDPSDDDQASEESQYEMEVSDTGSDISSFGDYVKKVMNNLGLNDQVKNGMDHVEEKLNVYQDEFQKLDQEYKQIEDSLDKVRKEFYHSFRPDLKFVPPIEIGPHDIMTKSKMDSHSDIIDETPVNSAVHLPPIAALARPELQPNTPVLCVKISLFARWVAAWVMEVLRTDGKDKVYKVQYQRHSKGGSVPMEKIGRHLAYFDPCPTRIPVGARIVARYRDDESKNMVISGSFYVGIVSEVPTAANKYRYLIFFDDGYAQYVYHHDVRVVVQSSECVWEDVASESREFIREYLQMYPERPMVRLQRHNYIKTEWSGRWWNAQVKEVDGSLVKMYFVAHERSEWIYRGSTRLSPLFTKKLAIQARAEQPTKTIRRRTAMFSRSGAVVEYGTFGQGQELTESQSSSHQETDAGVKTERRAVARKSTAARPCTPPKEVLNMVEQEKKGIARKLELPTVMPKYEPHLCSKSCIVSSVGSMNEYKGKSPLAFPIYYNWRRQVVKCRHSRRGFAQTRVFYVAPCGRRLRSIEEVLKYLRKTRSVLEIDCFSFEKGVDISNYWEPSKKLMWKEDISCGEENVKISCVNSLDEHAPPLLIYSSVRLPTSSVRLNLDPGFLVCCDCEDDCQDKSRCACWQLTIESTRVMGGTENPNIGYEYRRLYAQVQTGLYECNARCKCKSTCLNRVVQQPLRLNLQLFKTARRGWGVRTLQDIPRGGFLCVYVGKMLTENSANEEGKVRGGDDYFAELDFIEVMEDYKEGFEEDVEDEDGLLLGNNNTTKVTKDVEVNEDSDLPDSDGFFSDENEEEDEDNTTMDKDFSAAHAAKKVEQREKSARLKARESKKKGKRGPKKKNNMEEEVSKDIENSDETGSKSSETEKEEKGTDNKKKDNGKKSKNIESAKISTGNGANKNGSSGKTVESMDVGKEEDLPKGEKSEKNEKSEKIEKSETKSSGLEDRQENIEEDSSDEDDRKQRKPMNFTAALSAPGKAKKLRKSVRDFYGEDEAVYIMDAKQTGNIGRYLNHSCQPNVFVQNVFVDTHDLRFPWVAFFSSTNIYAGSELTWDYNYEVDSVPGKFKYCYCGAKKCRGRLL
ncbi:histone-lysine N-methyltransferase eggless-like isoform X2 [Oratosquilla oratoria]